MARKTKSSASLGKEQKSGSKKSAWNKGKSLGQKRAFKAEEIAEIGSILRREVESRPLAARDLALLRIGVDTMLRSSDLLRLTVGDVFRNGVVVADFNVRQKKTGQAQACDLMPESQDAIAAWLKLGWDFEPEPTDRLFAISGRQHGNIIKALAAMIRLDASKYGTHSIRRTKAKAVYARTKNLEIVRQLLGQKSLGATSAYLGVDREDARVAWQEVKI